LTWRSKAAEANKSLVAGQTVHLELEVDRRDRYGRLLAYVYVGDTATP
jgi:micrococcal nuclease